MGEKETCSAETSSQIPMHLLKYISVVLAVVFMFYFMNSQVLFKCLILPGDLFLGMSAQFQKHQFNVSQWM